MVIVGNYATCLCGNGTVYKFIVIRIGLYKSKSIIRTTELHVRSIDYHLDEIFCYRIAHQPLHDFNILLQYFI